MIGAPLPNAAQAWVPPAKMTRFLLDFTNRIAVDKRRPHQFTAMGYHMGNLEALERDRILVAQTYPVVKVDQVGDGITYTVDGEIVAPNGQTRTIRTEWIIRYGASRPQLTTAFPCGDDRR